MANPYQINDGESMASVRSKLNQMGEAVENSMQNPVGGEEGQVLTKTATGTEWQDASGGIASTTITNEEVVDGLPDTPQLGFVYFVLE